MFQNPSKVDVIDRLNAESEISRLISNYVHNVDDGKIAENAELLANARFTVGETVVHGRDEVALFSRTMSSITKMERREPGMQSRMSSLMWTLQRARRR